MRLCWVRRQSLELPLRRLDQSELLDAETLFLRLLFRHFYRRMQLISILRVYGFPEARIHGRSLFGRLGLFRGSLAGAVI